MFLFRSSNVDYFLLGNPLKLDSEATPLLHSCAKEASFPQQTQSRIHFALTSVCLLWLSPWKRGTQKYVRNVTSLLNTIKLHQLQVCFGPDLLLDDCFIIYNSRDSTPIEPRKNLQRAEYKLSRKLVVSPAAIFSKLGTTLLPLSMGSISLSFSNTIALVPRIVGVC